MENEIDLLDFVQAIGKYVEWTDRTLQEWQKRHPGEQVTEKTVEQNFGELYDIMTDLFSDEMDETIMNCKNGDILHDGE